MTGDLPRPSAFFIPLGEGRYAATELTRGPWSPEHQHGGPPSALLAREITRTSAISGGQTGRITMDILRPLPIATLAVTARVLRPGRRVEQIEAELRHDGELLIRATAWRLEAAALSAAAAPDPPPPLGAAVPVELPWWQDDVAYHRAFEWRLVSGSVDAPGPACVWARQTAELVAGEPPAPLERLVAMADAASGVSWQLPWERYLFPNVDFSLHLERPPAGEWMAMDAVTRPGAAGAGQCSAVLHDERGRVGISTQTLAIRER